MSLFQKSIEKNYLIELDSALIGQKYKQTQYYFGNPQIIHRTQTTNKPCLNKLQAPTNKLIRWFTICTN